MRDEVCVAVRFLIQLIERNNGEGELEREQLNEFESVLVSLFCERFKNHWFPEKPTRGQGYRCIRLNASDSKDPTIERAATQSGLTYQQLRLPCELTIWVDPREVCCRFGEHQGSFCTLASYKNSKGELSLEEVNLEEIYKKNKDRHEKVTQEMSTRKNGRRGFLAPPGNSNSPNFKTNRFTNGMSSTNGHGINSPNPIAVNWYNSVNSSQSSTSSTTTSSSMDMFSTSPPNQFSNYGLAKFSPPKYGYGTSSKWSTPPPPTSFGPSVNSTKTDKYHWFNSTKPSSIKA